MFYYSTWAPFYNLHKKYKNLASAFADARATLARNLTPIFY